MVSNYTLYYVTTPFCGVCKSAKPLVEILATSLAISLLEIDANHEKSLMLEHQITKVPALILMRGTTFCKKYEELTNLTSLFLAIEETISKDAGVK
ncbi:MAG: thioredoxin family protein [Culicoidibacterales bacterium]